MPLYITAYRIEVTSKICLLRIKGPIAKQIAMIITGTGNDAEA